MDYDRKQELLTNDNIKKDVRSLLLRDIRRAIITPVLLCVVLLPAVLVWRGLSGDSGGITRVIDIIMWVLIGIVAMAILGSLIILITGMRGLVLVNQNQWTIVTDELVEKTPGRRGGRYTIYKPHILRFATYGKYHIPEGRHYKWSQFYDMFARDVFHSSHIGETFMLVHLAGRQKTIVVAYNTRLFELAE